MRILLFMAIWIVIDSCNGVSTKMDFDGDDVTFEETNSTDTGDDDVEVKHTIVVSTKLKNNNRKGVRSNGDGNSEVSVYKASKKEDSGEVPIVNGYKAVETTRILTPDSRRKAAKIYPDAVFVNRNIHDDYDIHPNNVASNPAQWRPSNFYNNIHWRSPDGREYYYTESRPQNVNRKISDEAVREFHCGKCIELNKKIGRVFNACSGSAGLVQRPISSWMPTTPKMKLDGKLAKLN